MFLGTEYVKKKCCQMACTVFYLKQMGLFFADSVVLGGWENSITWLIHGDSFKKCEH